MGSSESRGANGLLSARIKELEIELADLRERNKRLEERDGKRPSLTRIQGEYLIQYEVEHDSWRAICRKCGENQIRWANEGEGQQRAWMWEHRKTHEDEECNKVHGTLADICDLVFDDEFRAANHGYEGVMGKIIDIRNQLTFHKLQIKKYCADFCTEKRGGPPCYTCALGKL